jgi:hypothetical protein
MAIQLLPRFLATISTRADGSVSLFLRLGSICLCIVSLITAIFSDGFLAILPGGFAMLWDIIYLILVSLRVKVVHPVIITFDLCSWLLAVIMAGVSIPWVIWDRWCENESDEDCDMEVGRYRLLGASCILLFFLS